MCAEHERICSTSFHPQGTFFALPADELDQSLLPRFAQMVECFPDHLAVQAGARSLTYRQLDAAADRVAHALLAASGAEPKAIALLFGMEIEWIVATLAVWKAGNFLIGMEPHQPLARNQFIVEDSGARLVVTNRKYAELAHQLWGGPDQVIVIEDLPTFDPPLEISGADTAYLLYTSGSTGKPKGTVENHRNLMAMMAVRQGVFHFSNQDRICIVGLASWCFSACAAFLYGGCLLPFRMKEEGLAKFSQFLIDRRITMVSSGSVMRTWLLSLDGSQQFSALRVINVGAGPSYLEHLQAFQRYLGEHCILVNTYSATECRSASLLVMEKHTRIETRLIPAGFPTLRGAIEIWDDHDKPLPVGEAGEIIAMTPFTAVGYWRSPELTAARFGVDAQGRRYYRTGDLGRLDEQGCLWVLGRKDSQVKIRGYRVETAEVEVALLELPTVHDVAVIALGESDESHVLVAFAVTTPVLGAGDDIRKQLATRLPDYMVPSSIYLLDEMPRNGNGKIDRPLLRARAKLLQAAQGERTVAFRSETEARVAALLTDMLPGGRIGHDDNFFDLGGHSLMAGRLMLRIQRTFGVDLPPRDFFAQPTVAALALSIDQALNTSHMSARPVQTCIEAVQIMRGDAEHLPIFLCPGGNGSLTVVLRYQQLIRRLGKQWPLVGLMTAESDVSSGLYTTVDELVLAALVALSGVQPHGPYLLLGECIGGKLAYEMARVLVQEGERVAMLTLLDAPMQPSQGGGKSLWQRWRGKTRALLERVAARRPATSDPDSPNDGGHLAQRRYFELLTQFRPSLAYPHPATAIFTREYEHHRFAWAALIEGLVVTVVEGQHDNYLRVSGEKVANELRALIASAQR